MLLQCSKTQKLFPGRNAKLTVDILIVVLHRIIRDANDPGDLGSSFSLQINAGAQNIFNSFQNDFDSGADRDSGYIYGPTLPRTFFLGVKLVY